MASDYWLQVRPRLHPTFWLAKKNTHTHPPTKYILCMPQSKPDYNDTTTIPQPYFLYSFWMRQSSRTNGHEYPVAIYFDKTNAQHSDSKFPKRSYVDWQKIKKSMTQTHLIWCQKPTTYISSVYGVVWKYHWMVNHSPSTMCLKKSNWKMKNYSNLKDEHTPLWSMMNALCQINRNVRKKNTVSLFKST